MVAPVLAIRAGWPSLLALTLLDELESEHGVSQTRWLGILAVDEVLPARCPQARLGRVRG